LRRVSGLGRIAIFTHGATGSVLLVVAGLLLI
jgi:hypothetical protein